MTTAALQMFQSMEKDLNEMLSSVEEIVAALNNDPEKDMDLHLTAVEELRQKLSLQKGDLARMEQDVE